MYSKITNPKTGRKVKINGILGQSIINNYINETVGGTIKTACMIFGRFQPPHLSHGELIDLTIQTAKDEGGQAFLFTSKKDNDFEDPKKLKSYHNSRSESAKKKKAENPIKINNKLDILYRLHGHKDIVIVDVVGENISNPIQAVSWLKSKGFDNIIFLAGTDRVDGYSRSFSEYEDVEIRELPRPKGAISGTAVRELALETIIDLTNRLIEIKELSENVSEDEISQIENLITIYSQVKGRDSCYTKLKRILDLIKSSTKTLECDDNISLIFDMISLIKQGSP